MHVILLEIIIISKSGVRELETYCRQLVMKMYSNGIIDRSDIPVYLFEFQIVFESLIVHMLLLLYFTAVKAPFEGLIFIVAFALLRSGTGGFHCKTNAGCIALSITVSAITYFMKTFWQQWRLAFLIITVISIAFIVLTDPVNHPYMAWSEKEIIYARRYVRFIVTGLLLELLVFKIIKIGFEPEYYLSSAFIQCAGSMLIAKILRQEVRQNEG